MVHVFSLNLLVRIRQRKTGRGSSVGSQFASYASGPEIDPRVRYILS